MYFTIIRSLASVIVCMPKNHIVDRSKVQYLDAIIHANF